MAPLGSCSSYQKVHEFWSCSSPWNSERSVSEEEERGLPDLLLLLLLLLEVGVEGGAERRRSEEFMEEPESVIRDLLRAWRRDGEGEGHGEEEGELEEYMSTPELSSVEDVRTMEGRLWLVGDAELRSGELAAIVMSGEALRRGGARSSA